LEKERVRVSLPLAQEKDILKQIHKLMRRKVKVQAYIQTEQSIRLNKVRLKFLLFFLTLPTRCRCLMCHVLLQNRVTELRNKLRECNDELKTIRWELATVKTANQLGCPVEELVGRAVACPPEKLGQIIGKKGRHLQQLSASAAVQMEVNKSEKKNVVRMIGPLASLDAAVMDLGKLFQQTEEKLDADEKLLEYLTAKGVTALQEIRASHPDVRLDASREKGMVCRGIPEDIAAFRKDLPVIQSETLTVTSKEAALVVGKNGATIESIVESHQTAIQLLRGEVNTTIKVIGPSGHVESAIREIEELLAANREGVLKMNVQVPIKNALLLENGKGARELTLQVNNHLEATGAVTLNFEDGALIVRGKARVLETAAEKVQAEVRRLEQLMVSIQVDPMVIPVFIGKGGSGIKDLKDGKPVTIELDKETGKIDIAGLESSSIDYVRERTQALANTQLVERIQSDPPSAYKTLMRGFVRTLAKEVTKLVFLKLEDESQQVILRGSREKLEEAKALINQYFAQNYSQEMEVTKDDIQALLTGGKNSKIVELAEKTGVKLNTVRDRQIIVVRGEKEKVADAIQSVKSYLYGGEGISLMRISIDKNAVGLVIGKGGKNKEVLEQKYNVSIMIERNENVLTLRGQDVDIEACRADIMKQIVTARVTQSLKATVEELELLRKANVFRRIMQSMPVQLLSKDDTITLRGVQDDVNDAIAILNETLGKSYRMRYRMDGILYHRLQEAWKDPAHAKQIESSTHAKLHLTQNTLSFTGSRKQVTDAKREALKYFEFLFGSQFCHVSVPSSSLPGLGKSGAILNTMASSGCQLFLDRDLSAVLFFCSDTKKLEVAREAIKLKIEEENKRSFVLKLDDSEEWIVSLVLGKNGDSIKSLRKETGCQIDVHDRIITVTADQTDLVSSGKAKLESLVEKARRECVFVAVPAKHMPAFVGRSGANITKFSTEYGVEIQIMKKGTNDASVRLTGEGEAVSNAHDAIIEWIEMRDNLGAVREVIGTRDTSRRKDQPSTTIKVESDQIARIIGKKGAVIRGLENEFNCEIRVDRKMNTVTISAANLETVTERIQMIAQAVHSRKLKATENLDAEDGAGADELVYPKSGPNVPVAKSDFPTIGGEYGEESHSHDSPMKGNTITWAAVTKPLTGTEFEISFDARESASAVPAL
jgi:polyribonucleotide nucleotidyltransferase